MFGTADDASVSWDAAGCGVSLMSAGESLLILYFVPFHVFGAGDWGGGGLPVFLLLVTEFDKWDVILADVASMVPPRAHAKEYG